MSSKFKDINELKAFIKWCKAEKIQFVTIDGITFSFDSAALMLESQMGETSNLETQTPITNEHDYDGRDLSEPPQMPHTTVDEDEETLFWSAE